MKIPVFVSCPTDLSPAQEASRKVILRELANLDLEPRAIGRSDYPTELPLREVLILARHCAGGVVLGFVQFESKSGVLKPGTEKERQASDRMAFPTPWNQLEAGILFGLQLPLLVFREEPVAGRCVRCDRCLRSQDPCPIYCGRGEKGTRTGVSQVAGRRPNEVLRVAPLGYG